MLFKVKRLHVALRLMLAFILVFSIIGINAQVLICSAGSESEISGPESHVSKVGLQQGFPILSELGIAKLIIHIPESSQSQSQTPDNSNPQPQAIPTSKNRKAQTGSSSENPATTETKPMPKDLFSQMERSVGYYNSGIDEVPIPLKKLAGNDIIFLNIGLNDGSKLQIKAVTENGKIVEFRKLAPGEKVDASVSVHCSEDTFRGIMYSKDPLNTFVTALNSGKLNIECKGMLKKGALLAVKTLA
jgi:hypothetical protein